jgi:hypothetical protein
LPLEEALFFFITVTLLAFGMALTLAPESRARLAAFSRDLPRSVGFTRSKA